MEIGKEQPAIWVEPLTRPAQAPTPEPTPAPKEVPATTPAAPEREKVGV